MAQALISQGSSSPGLLLFSAFSSSVWRRRSWEGGHAAAAAGVCEVVGVPSVFVRYQGFTLLMHELLGSYPFLSVSLCIVSWEPFMSFLWFIEKNVGLG